eukprot:COSAG01_NODE_35110_length_536_cov_56.505721_1_plen_83_part_00
MKVKSRQRQPSDHTIINDQQTNPLIIQSSTIITQQQMQPPLFNNYRKISKRKTRHKINTNKMAKKTNILTTQLPNYQIYQIH